MRVKTQGKNQIGSRPTKPSTATANSERELVTNNGVPFGGVTVFCRESDEVVESYPVHVFSYGVSRV